MGPPLQARPEAIVTTAGGLGGPWGGGASRAASPVASQLDSPGWASWTQLAVTTRCLHKAPPARSLVSGARQECPALVLLQPALQPSQAPARGPRAPAWAASRSLGRSGSAGWHTQASKRSGQARAPWPKRWQPEALPHIVGPAWAEGGVALAAGEASGWVSAGKHLHHPLAGAGGPHL